MLGSVERRYIRLEGNLNLRDLGGYETGSGQLVRGRCVFRSDELHALTGPDLDVVMSLGAVRSSPPRRAALVEWQRSSG
jgi:protein-tyrosine phosphatase